MSILSLLVLLVIAGICGALAEMIVGFSPGGFVVSIVVGVIGAYIGTVVANALNLPPFFAINVGGQTIEIIWAILGSILLLLVISMFRRSGRRVGRRNRF